MNAQSTTAINPQVMATVLAMLSNGFTAAPSPAIPQPTVSDDLDDLDTVSAEGSSTKIMLTRQLSVFRNTDKYIHEKSVICAGMIRVPRIQTMLPASALVKVTTASGVYWKTRTIWEITVEVKPNGYTKLLSARDTGMVYQKAHDDLDDVADDLDAVQEEATATPAPTGSNVTPMEPPL